MHDSRTAFFLLLTTLTILVLSPGSVWYNEGSAPTAPSSAMAAAGDAGQILWNSTYGDQWSTDQMYDVIECSTGGFLMAGDTYGYEAQVADVFIVRTNSSGDTVWYRTFGGPRGDHGVNVIECSDGGFAVLSVRDNVGTDNDLWLIKTNSTGHEMWNQTYSLPDSEYAVTVVELDDGFAVLSDCWNATAGAMFAWLVRTDESGNALWNRTYGSTEGSDGADMVPCPDGGFLIVGDTLGYGAQAVDGWILKVGSDGQPLWNKTYGTYQDDYLSSVASCSDGGFICGGRTFGGLGGGADYWLLKVFDNGTQEWSGISDSGTTAYCGGVIEVQGGGYVMVGYRFESLTEAMPDAFVVRYDAEGNQCWQTMYGQPGEIDEAYSVVETSEGGFVVTGRTESYGVDSTDGFLFLISDPLAWREQPCNQEILIGETFRYDLNATSWKGVDSWWINDTSHFGIDTEGVIANSTVLAAGDYALRVYANDTTGDIIDAEFVVTVHEPTTITTTTTTTTTTATTTTSTTTTTVLPPLDSWLWIAAAAGGIVVVMLAVAVRRRH